MLHYFDEDGNLIDPKKVPIPELCFHCAKFCIDAEKDLCMLNRHDQRNNQTFSCYAYKEMEAALERRETY